MTHPATDLIVSWWSARFERADKREAFAAALKERVGAAWEKAESAAREFPEWLPHVSLEVDYDPGGALLEAIRDAGIECRGFMFSADGLLPKKTRMYVWLDRVETVEGYGAPDETIWTTDNGDRQ